MMMLGENMANWRSRLSQKNLVPSELKVIHLWKWMNKPSCIKEVKNTAI
jgi:hypothetical protein